MVRFAYIVVDVVVVNGEIVSVFCVDRLMFFLQYLTGL